MSEINPTDHEGNTAHIFPDRGFREAISIIVEFKKDNQLDEADSQKFMVSTNAILVCITCLVPGSSPISCVTPLGSQDQAVREALRESSSIGL